jgi:hypothetical protein
VNIIERILFVVDVNQPYFSIFNKPQQKYEKYCVNSESLSKNKQVWKKQAHLQEVQWSISLTRNKINSQSKKDPLLDDQIAKLMYFKNNSLCFFSN